MIIDIDVEHDHFNRFEDDIESMKGQLDNVDALLDNFEMQLNTLGGDIHYVVDNTSSLERSLEHALVLVFVVFIVRCLRICLLV